VSRQPDFKPPSQKFRQEIIDEFKRWRDEDQCTVWTKACIHEWAKNSSKVWGIRKVGTGGYYSPRLSRTLSPRLLSKMAPYDVASNIHQALLSIIRTWNPRLSKLNGIL